MNGICWDNREGGVKGDKGVHITPGIKTNWGVFTEQLSSNFEGNVGGKIAILGVNICEYSVFAKHGLVAEGDLRTKTNIQAGGYLKANDWLEVTNNAKAGSFSWMGKQTVGNDETDNISYTGDSVEEAISAAFNRANKAHHRADDAYGYAGTASAAAAAASAHADSLRNDSITDINTKLSVDDFNTFKDFVRQAATNLQTASNAITWESAKGWIRQASTDLTNAANAGI